MPRQFPQKEGGKNHAAERRKRGRGLFTAPHLGRSYESKRGKKEDCKGPELLSAKKHSEIKGCPEEGKDPSQLRRRTKRQRRPYQHAAG